MRIDTLRASITATIQLLERVHADLDTLHALAYERKTADLEIRIKGGLPDYALDNHGDPTSRAALKALGEHIRQGRDHIATGAHNAIRAIDNYGPTHQNNSRHPARITAVELAQALDAQDRRSARGEYTPARTHPQPVIAGLEKQLRQRIKQLEKENKQLRKVNNRPV